MAQYLSNELAGTTTGLTTAAAAGVKPNATVYGARLKRLRATVTMAAQATTDTLLLANLPAGATFAYGVINASATLGTSTLAIGVASTTGKYRAAATFTTADTPTLFGTAATEGLATPATAEEAIIGTIAVAALPASGTLIVDIFYSMPS